MITDDDLDGDVKIPHTHSGGNVIKLTKPTAIKKDVRTHPFTFVYRAAFIGLFDQGMAPPVDKHQRSVLVNANGSKNIFGCILPPRLVEAMRKDFNNHDVTLNMAYGSDQFGHIVMAPMGWSYDNVVDCTSLIGLAEIQESMTPGLKGVSFRLQLIDQFNITTKQLGIPFDASVHRNINRLDVP